MNVSRSTFVQKGYVLTALIVAVLLAGFSGTAWAQTTRTISANASFSPTSGTLEEGANANLDTSTPLRVTIRRSDPSTGDPYEDSASTPHLSIKAEYNDADITAANGAGEFAVRVVSGSDGNLSGLAAAGGTATLNFTDSDSDGDVDNEIVLMIDDIADEGDWIPEKLVLTLTKGSGLGGEGGGTADDPTIVVRDFTSRLTVTITDDEETPKLKFTPPNIQLAKGNTLPVTVGVGVGPGGRVALPTAASGTDSVRATLADLTGNRDDVLLSVSPADAVGNLIEFVDSMGEKVTLTAAGQDMYNIGKIGAGTGLPAGVDGAVGAVDATENDGIDLYIKAINVSGFRDEQIMLTLMEGRTEAQKAGDGGGIDDSDPATVTILSGEETPTVTFSKASVSIVERESETVHLLADTDQGDQVGSATVAVSGDARISLEQNGSALSGGTVSFDGSANAELTIRALGDESLEDGEEKTATVTITDASGANIGDPRTLTVTVEGSTAVPVLPLVGQLLLALLLTAGGARLYRRRQG